MERETEKDRWVYRQKERETESEKSENERKKRKMEETDGRMEWKRET